MARYGRLLVALLVAGGVCALGPARAAADTQAQAIVKAAAAMEAAGYPYCFDGGTTRGPSAGIPDPDTDGAYSDCGATPGKVGFDCTGLTLYAVYQATGNAGLSHGPGQPQSGNGRAIAHKRDLRPGDVVFFDDDTTGQAMDHAGIYVGENRVLSAVSEKYGIRTETFAWYESGGHRRFIGGVRYWKAGAAPVGRLESVTGDVGKVRVAGWTYDPDAPKLAVRVIAWLDGKPNRPGARKVDLGWANRARPDVARVHSAAGPAHGFKFAIDHLSAGVHTVRVYGLNRASGGTLGFLGAKTIRVPAGDGDDGTSGSGDDGSDPDPDPTPVPDPRPATPPTSLAWSAGAGAEYQSFLGDFNGDGQVDIGLRRIATGRFYWRFGPAFDQTIFDWSAGAGPEYQSFLGDFNGDGQVDIGLRRIATGRFYWRLGPAFDQTIFDWSAGAGPEYQSFLGDFNGDGQVDIGLRRIATGRFYWRLGPSFDQTQYDWTEGAGSEYESFLGDFNGDHQVDVGLRRIATGRFYWRLGPSFNQFQYDSPASAGTDFQGFLGDFNGDRQVDVGSRRVSDGTFSWRVGPLG